MKKNIALLCGRAGSVSVRDKNTYPVLGRPMMMYPLLAAKAARKVDDIFISTDSVQMQRIAAENGVKVIDRPKALATATSQHVDTLIHALGEIRERGISIDKLIVLMCNCATYPRGIVDRCITRLEEDPDSDSCVTGYIENDHHPYRVKSMGPRGYLETWMNLDSIAVSTNRQDLPPCHILDHAMWIIKVDRCFPPRGQKPWTFMGNNILFENNPGSCDIHSVEDIHYTEKYLKDNGWSELKV